MTLVDDVDLSTPADSVFGDNSSCVLWPSMDAGDLPEGPYCKLIHTWNTFDQGGPRTEKREKKRMGMGMGKGMFP